MGRFAEDSVYSNAPSPTTGAGLAILASNQRAILELPGAQAPQLVTIADGAITPTGAFLRVDTEGQAPADDLEVINIVLSASDNLHDGMLLYLQAADQDRTVTVKRTANINGIQTFDGQDVELTATTWLPLQLQGERWVEVFGTRMQEGLEAIQDANVIATTSLAGKVKPDGTTIEVAPDGTISSKATGRNIGEVFYSLLPLSDAGLHLVDGSLLPGDGVYAEFVAHVTGLQATHPGLFVTEADWQDSVTQYGVCGKFVYDSTANTLRLPKVTGFIEGTLNATALGDLVEAGLPNITGTFNTNGSEYENFSDSTSVTINGAFSGYWRTQYNIEQKSGTARYVSGFNFDASRSSSLYGNSNTVQPQAIKGFIYMVVSNRTKTQITADIDQIAADLQGKADTGLANTVPTAAFAAALNAAGIRTVVETWHSGTEWYRVWSDGWIEQGGITSGTGRKTVNLNRQFTNTSYSVFISMYTADSTGYNNIGVFTRKTLQKFETYNVYESGPWYACGY